MAQQAMMPGPDGAVVSCYRRGARNVAAGDWLPDYGAHVVAPAMLDQGEDTGRPGYWVTLEDGRDVWFTMRGKVWLFRRYAAPDWMTAALEAYRDARDAREAMRESSAPVPAGAVAGAAGSLVAWCQLEDDDFRRVYPAPRLADFIRDAAASRREPAA